MKTIRLACVVGARPNFMKMAPILRALDELGDGVEAVLIHTGQHYDKNLSDVFFEDLQMRRPDVYLDVGSGTHAQQTARVMERMEKVLAAAAREGRPFDRVVVVGDVNSTMAATLAAAKLLVPVAHVLFVAVFLYAVGFTSNLIVPKSIDAGQTAPLLQSILVNLAVLGLFAVQHSVMARPAFKRQWTKLVPKPIERSTFVLATVCCFGLLFWLWHPMPQVIWEAEAAWLRVTLLGISLAGYALVLYTSFLIDHFELFGVKQVWWAWQGREPPRPVFTKRSFYKHIRHPLMTGFLIAFWATPTLTVGHLLFAAVVTGYILVGTALEERDLAEYLGPEYEQYAAETPRFFPRLTGPNGLAGIFGRSAGAAQQASAENTAAEGEDA